MDIAALLALREGTTPGPLRIVRNHDGSINIVSPKDADGDSHKVALINGWDMANARLIAAAPDLLDALAALQAENAALRARLDAAEDRSIDEARIDVLHQEIAALRAQVDEAVAGAYLDAAAKAHECWIDGVPAAEIANHIMTLIPADATAALARRDAETRKAALREAAACAIFLEDENRILALIKEPRHG